MENNIQAKEIFIAQYYGQKVAKCIKGNDNHPVGKTVIIDDYLMSALRLEKHGLVEYILELKSLENITEEHAIEFCRLQYGYTEKPILKDGTKIAIRRSKYQYITISNNFYSLISPAADYLRLKSYALPFMGISVAEQIERGWIVIKGNK